MLSLENARKLKASRLNWTPENNDYFAIPDREMDSEIFVISALMSHLGRLHGEPVVAFHGTAEWAVDHIATSEIVWIPREDQLRKELEMRLPAQPLPNLVLETTVTGFCVTIVWENGRKTFEAENASDAYAQALLFVLAARGNES